MRYSTDEYDAAGHLVNGSDYELQVWVIDGIIQDCGHRFLQVTPCCNARKYSGRRLVDVLRAMQQDRDAIHIAHAVATAEAGQ